MAILQETTQDHPNQSLASKIGQFIWHWVQIFFAMEVGMIVYHLLLRRVLAGTGFAALTQDSRLFGLVIMIVFIMLGMIVLLHFRRSTWHYSLKTTLAVIAPLASFTVLLVMTLIPT